jgi:hypothetical protein
LANNLSTTVNHLVGSRFDIQMAFYMMVVSPFDSFDGLTFPMNLNPERTIENSAQCQLHDTSSQIRGYLRKFTIPRMLRKVLKNAASNLNELEVPGKMRSQTLKQLR